MLWERQRFGENFRVTAIFKIRRAKLFNSFKRLKEDDIPGRKEEGRDARSVDKFDGKTDAER